MMNVIALQKDNELFICNFARSFIESFNRQNRDRGIALYPNFPLWAFVPSSFQEDKYKTIFSTGFVQKAYIGQTDYYKNDETNLFEFYFPLYINAYQNTNSESSTNKEVRSIEKESADCGCYKQIQEFKIIFAKTSSSCNNDFSLAAEQSEEKKFPLKIKSFRTGICNFENNGWSLSDEKWIRCKEK